MFPKERSVPVNMKLENISGFLTEFLFQKVEKIFGLPDVVRQAMSALTVPSVFNRHVP
jgi:hypothetical protein